MIEAIQSNITPCSNLATPIPSYIGGAGKVVKEVVNVLTGEKPDTFTKTEEKKTEEKKNPRDVLLDSIKNVYESIKKIYDVLTDVRDSNGDSLKDKLKHQPWDEKPTITQPWDEKPSNIKTGNI